MFGSKREERNELIAALDRGFENDGHLQIGDVAYDMSTPEGWQAYQAGCDRVGELVIEVQIEEARPAS